MLGGGEEIGLRVRVTTVPAKSSLDRLGKEAQRSMGAGMTSAIKGITPSFKAMYANVASSLRGMPSMKGMGGGMGKMIGGGSVGTFAGLTIIAQGIFGLVKQVVGYLAEASPMLRATLKMLNVGFMSILRPIGDVLAMLLRPVAMFFRVIGKSVMQKFLQRRKELLASGMSGPEAAAQLFSEMPTMYAEVFGESVAGIDWGRLLERVILPILTSSFMNFHPLGIMYRYLEMGVKELAKFGSWLWTEICKALGNAASWLGDLFNGLASFGAWIWDEILKALGTAAAWMASMFDGTGSLGNWLWTEVKKALSIVIPAGESAQSITNTAKTSGSAEAMAAGSLGWGLQYGAETLFNWFGGHGPLLDDGGEVLKTGLAVVHKGETYSGVGHSEPPVINNYNTINVPMDKLADALDRRMDARIELFARNEMRRRVGV